MCTLAAAMAATMAADGRTASAPSSQPATAPAQRNVAVEKTSKGDLIVQPINHSAIRFGFRGKQYYVDPSGRADWGRMPKADVILITHEHRDHLDRRVIDRIRKDGTAVWANASSVKKAGFGRVIEVGQRKRIADITVEAVAAYNINPRRRRYHPKARKDNGYVLTFGGKRVYVAGDTEGTPEMKALKNIAIAFLPIKLPYTMPPKEAAEAARAFKPKVLYPYHQGRGDPKEVRKLLADEKAIRVRVLRLP
jgi:L-ascorbate metabolism protein UlaG (beta-lactamase superfamily)